MAEFTVLDWALLAVLLASVLVSLLGGLVREAMSLVAWLATYFLATMFSPGMEALAGDVIASEEVRRIAAFGAVFIATLIMGSLVTYLAGLVVKLTGLGVLDRLLGMAFGALRGVVAAVVATMVLRAALDAAGAQPPWFTDSVLVPHLLLMENWVKDTSQPVAAWVREIVK